MKGKRKLIYLRASTEILAQRLYPNIKNRPLLQGVSSKVKLKSLLKNLLTDREPTYLQADFIFQTDKSEAKNLQGLLREIKSITWKG
ncbi:MAG: hypothetical protein IPO14_06985 [Saprospiraceae bacterium]|nr:hypothetical protein [Saprospiraceae bacterium]